jgi:hypothetical protein
MDGQAIPVTTFAVEKGLHPRRIKTENFSNLLVALTWPCCNLAENDLLCAV